MKQFGRLALFFLGLGAIAGASEVPGFGGVIVMVAGILMTIGAMN